MNASTLLYVLPGAVLVIGAMHVIKRKLGDPRPGVQPAQSAPAAPPLAPAPVQPAPAPARNSWGGPNPPGTPQRRVAVKFPKKKAKK